MRTETTETMETMEAMAAMAAMAAMEAMEATAARPRAAGRAPRRIAGSTSGVRSRSPPRAWRASSSGVAST
jgi:hypothetical protein